MREEQLQKRLEEVHNNHTNKLEDNWKIQQTVQFSLEELNALRAVVASECGRYYKKYGREDSTMQALARKIDEYMVDIEVRIRDEVEE